MNSADIFILLSATALSANENYQHKMKYKCCVWSSYVRVWSLNRKLLPLTGNAVYVLQAKGTDPDQNKTHDCPGWHCRSHACPKDVSHETSPETQVRQGFWLTWRKMLVYVLINVRPVGRVPGRGKNFNIAIFSDTTNVIIVCLFISLLVTKVISVPNSCNWNFVYSYPFDLIICRIVMHMKEMVYTQLLFPTFARIQGK